MPIIGPFGLELGLRCRKDTTWLDLIIPFGKNELFVGIWLSGLSAVELEYIRAVRGSPRLVVSMHENRAYLSRVRVLLQVIACVSNACGAD